MRRHSFIRTVAVALAFAALGAPTAASAKPADTAPAPVAGAGQDLRMPDRRGPEAPVVQARGTDVAAADQQAPASAPLAPSASEGIDWVAIGGGSLAFLLVVSGMGLVLTRYRHEDRHGRGRLTAALADSTRAWRRGVGL
jgi:hypothetical protein